MTDRASYELLLCSTFPGTSTIAFPDPAAGASPYAARHAGRRPIRDTLEPMAADWQDAELLRHVFEQTEVVRKPITGIVAGYHVLPYVLVAPEAGHPGRSVEVCGRIRVSPRLVLGVGSGGPTYGEVFAERELMDRAVVARVFSFRYAPRVWLESDDLQIRRQDRAAPAHLERVLDDLARREVIDTGVIQSPDARFYPVSLDRFIREILDQEFRE